MRNVYCVYVLNVCSMNYIVIKFRKTKFYSVAQSLKKIETERVGSALKNCKNPKGIPYIIVPSLFRLHQVVRKLVMKGDYNKVHILWEVHKILRNLHLTFVLQSCAKELEWSLFQDSGRTIHSGEKNDTSYKRTRFFTEMKQKKIKMADLENSKWPPQKNLVFQLRQFSIFFHEIFMVWSFG